MDIQLRQIPSEIRKQLDQLCTEIACKSTCIEFLNNNDSGQIVRISEEYSEVFPGIYMKAVFSDNNFFRVFVRAEKNSVIDIHRMFPSRFMYVIEGEHEELVTGVISTTGDSFSVESMQPHGSKFNSDTKLLIQFL